MELTILGNRSPYPMKEGGCSSYLLQVKEQNFLLDIGSGTLQNLNQVIDYHQLDGVVISHLHEDHWLDLYPLHYAVKRNIKKGLREEPLPVYLPFSEGPELDYIQNKLGAEYQLQPIAAGEDLDLGPIEVEFKLTEHSKECYALRIKGVAQEIGYTADTGEVKSLVEFLTGVDLLLTEATLLPEDDQPDLPHLTINEAVDLGDKTKARKTVLTHLGSEYSRQEIKESLPATSSKVEVSKVLASYNLD